jgi:sec-independent protein translocase protein TatA
MGIESPVHLLFIAAVALVVLGPKRLPQLARAIGQGIREFRGAIESGQSEPEQEPAEGGEATSASVSPPVGDARSEGHAPEASEAAASEAAPDGDERLRAGAG